MLRRWILPVLLILVAGAAGAWALATRGGDPADQDRRAGERTGLEAPVPQKPPDRGPPFAVMFGGELVGRLWVPPCSQFRQGGLARVGNLVHEMASSIRFPVLLDTGDETGAPGEGGATELNAALRALSDCGLAVAAVGERDLSVGLERWRAVKNGLPPELKLVCANLRDDQDRELVPAVAHLVLGRKKVLVVAVLSPSFEKGLRGAGVPVKILPPAAAVREALAAAGKADFVIVLSHAPPEESRALLKEVTAIDLVITAHAGTLPWREPEVLDGRTVLAPGAGWQFVCVAGFRDNGEGRRPELVEHANRPVSANIQSTGPLELHLSMALTRVRTPGFLEAMLGEAAAREPADAPAFTGPASCASCHPAAHAKWSADPHARSMASVRAKKFDGVWSCLACHATAPGKRGGHLKPGDEQEAVTCEACHGPGGAHAAADGRVPLATPKDSCALCHIPEMSPGFSFDAAWPKVVHGR
jgi:hypothetical protein